ncbi:MAG: hypothetical protein EBU84_15390 [Actinobacteria bacterium]|nr:hypothetical protein [Actinomycetota bacterium]
MYIPAHFSIKNLELMHQIIHAHPLGVLVTMTPPGRWEIQPPSSSTACSKPLLALKSPSHGWKVRPS